MNADLTDHEHQMLLRHVAGLNWIRNTKDKNEFFCPSCYWDQAFGEGTPQSNGYYYCPHCGARLIGWVYLNPGDPEEAKAAEILKANLEAVKC